MKINIDDLIEEINKTDKDVVFFDTCSILNILNCITQDSNYVYQTIKLIEKLENVCDFVIPEMVYEEWGNNIEAVQQNLKSEILKCENTFNSILDSINLLLDAKYSLLKVSDLGISDMAYRLSKKVLDSSYIINREDEYAVKAMHRVRECLAPAKKGKSEPKDCEIIECFFDMCSQLRESGYSRKIIFVTANKSDFGTANKPLSPLDEEFRINGAYLVNDLQHLNHLIGDDY